MDYEYEGQGSSCSLYLFRVFVCLTLTLLLGIQVYSYLWGPQDSFDAGFGEVKYVVMQLSRGLSEVNRKHERLQNELERISAVFPSISAAASRAKDAMGPSIKHSFSRHAVDIRDYDRQMADFALESAGAKIVDTGDTIDYVVYDSPVSWALHVLVAMVCRECQGARAVINPGTLPGECWAFKGSKGEVTIRLSGLVRVTAISIEHIPVHISPTKDISSAPRLFQVEGLEYRRDAYPHDFGSFEYDKDGMPIQYFEILHPSSKGFGFVKIRILTNWGHPLYTCVYRIRIHGELESSKPITKDATIDDDLQIENEEVGRF